MGFRRWQKDFKKVYTFKKKTALYYSSLESSLCFATVSLKREGFNIFYQENVKKTTGWGDINVHQSRWQLTDVTYISCSQQKRQ